MYSHNSFHFYFLLLIFYFTRTENNRAIYQNRVVDKLSSTEIQLSEKIGGLKKKTRLAVAGRILLLIITAKITLNCEAR